jgi:transcriptional regulator with XRE-family HTH domain
MLHFSPQTNLRIGRYLKERRLALGLSQHIVAKTLLCTPQFISNMECGRAPLPMYNLSKIVTLYKIDRLRFLEFMMTEQRRHLKELLEIKSLPRRPPPDPQKPPR